MGSVKNALMVVNTIPLPKHALIFVDSTKFIALLVVCVKMGTMISEVSVQDAPTKPSIILYTKDANVKEDSNTSLVHVSLYAL